ncbi:MAG: hypothetical protein JWN45_1892 [Acidobacteriaceae bacterium]|nr:hypothetical protein [Acidobacteriaceae bacterium]
MTMAKVAHLTSVHSPLDVRIFHKECRSLVRGGHEVTIVAPHTGDEIESGVHIKAVPPIPCSQKRLTRMTRTVWNVLRQALRLNADIYHFHDPELIPVGIYLAAIGKKVIYDIHEDVPCDILSKEYIPKWLRVPIASLAKILEIVGAICVSALVTVTPNIAERFKRYNSSTVIVYNFPLLNELSSVSGDWHQREMSVAYLGGILVERGIREMVHAMALLPDKLQASLELARDDFPEGLYEEISAHLGWARVSDWGTVDRTAVASILNRVRAGLVLFHPEPNNISAMPHKFFEYMSASIPVIASDFPLWREIIDGAKCGLLVNPLDPRSIAASIEYVLTHPEEAEAMGRRGRAAVEQFYNWEAQERILLNLYANLLDPAAAVVALPSQRNL